MSGGVKRLRLSDGTSVYWWWCPRCGDRGPRSGDRSKVHADWQTHLAECKG